MSGVVFHIILHNSLLPGHPANARMPHLVGRKGDAQPLQPRASAESSARWSGLHGSWAIYRTGLAPGAGGAGRGRRAGPGPDTPAPILPAGCRSLCFPGAVRCLITAFRALPSFLKQLSAPLKEMAHWSNVAFIVVPVVAQRLCPRVKPIS